MKINNEFVLQKYQLTSAVQKSNIEDRAKDGELSSIENQELRKLADEFTSILIKQMFKSMRSTLPENKLLSGDFAEDVFTDMYDGEISKMGSKQANFNQLSNVLYRQLLEKQGE